MFTGKFDVLGQNIDVYYKRMMFQFKILMFTKKIMF